MANEIVKICSTCKQEKTFAEMRKAHNGKLASQCNYCANEVRQKRVQKERELKKQNRQARLEKPKPVEVKVTDLVPPRTFTFAPYVPEKHWVRNNGNVHIPSRGYQC